MQENDYYTVSELDDLKKKAREHYRRLAPELEAHNRGDCVVIHVASGKFVIASNEVAALALYAKRFNTEAGLLKRIGGTRSIHGH